MGKIEIENRIVEAIISYYTRDINSKQANELLSWIEQSVDNLKHFQSIGEVFYISGITNKHVFDLDKGFLEFKRNINEDF